MVADRKVHISVLKDQYAGILGTIPNPISVSATWQWQGDGTATLIVLESGPVAARLLQCAEYVVPVSILFPGFPRWTGWVVRAESTKVAGQTGRIVVNLISERRWLDRILAAPKPSAPWNAQTDAHDTRTGPLATIALQYVSANVARINALAPPVPDLPIVVANPPSPDTSPVLTIQARNQSIAEEVGPSLMANGYDLTVTLWLPGDPQPNVTTPLTVPTMVADVVKGRQQDYVNFSEDRGGLMSRNVVAVHPTATAVVVGGPGELAARLFEYYVADDGRLDKLGPWGYSEEFLDAVDADTPAIRAQRAKDKLAEDAGKVAVSFVVDDRRPWKAGPASTGGDYWVGDNTRVTFNGLAKSDRIDRITVTLNEDGLTVSPQFGETSATETADQRLIRIVGQLSREIAELKAET